MSKDPVKRGLNQYRYCDNDPVDYTDPTGEIAHIAWAAGLGGIFGFGGGFLESAFSQTMDGGDIDWMEALGSGVKGAITGATQAGLLASGAGLPTALFANALAGTAGSAAEQYIGGGRIDPEKSILGGLSNAVSNAIYGTDPLGSGKEAFLRGMGDGAANAALNYLFDTTGNKGVSGAGALPGIAGALFSPYEALRDPRRKCGSASPFIPVPGYGPAKGYQYEMPGAGSGNANTPKKFSICDFLLETVIGGITGGLSSAAFYGAGKGIERLMDGLRPGRGGEKELFLPDEYYQKIDDNIAKAIAARDAEVARIQGLSMSQQRKVATVVGGVDLRTGEIFVGAKDSSRYGRLAVCAEDIVYRGLGGNQNANIIMTSAVRPRTGQSIPVCVRCQTKYPFNQFIGGTLFQ